MIDRHIHTAINPSDVYPVPGCDECRIMAAAPDMLALLETVVPVIESSIRVGKGFSDPEPWLVEQIEYLDGLLADVHAAIAKARGED